MVKVKTFSYGVASTVDEKVNAFLEKIPARCVINVLQSTAQKSTHSVQITVTVVYNSDF